jgi:hypothetical protein
VSRYSALSKYRSPKPPAKPKLGTLLPVINGSLAAGLKVPGKQRHTDRQIFKRLRDEHGYTGS